MGRSRDQNAAGWAELLQTGRHVDAVAQEIIALDHHVAQVDADAQDDPALGGICLLTVSNRLDCRGAGHRADDGPELGDEAVAHQLHHAAAVLGQKRLQHRLPQALQGRERPSLVGLDKARVADHVGGHDRCQSAFRLRRCHPSP